MAPIPTRRAGAHTEVRQAIGRFLSDTQIYRRGRHTTSKDLVGGGEREMLLLKQEIVEMLRDNGDVGTAHQAEAKLPDEVDTDKDGDLLKQEGIDIDYLLSRR
ncbi:MAG: hypothetical protein H0T91_07545 [Propionibacteriaceae bacterium]|nr:hypothetical protein [Propionibacteriaceae bacterium]